MKNRVTAPSVKGNWNPDVLILSACEAGDKIKPGVSAPGNCENQIPARETGGRFGTGGCHLRCRFAGVRGRFLGLTPIRAKLSINPLVSTAKRWKSASLERQPQENCPPNQVAERRKQRNFGISVPVPPRCGSWALPAVPGACAPG